MNQLFSGAYPILLANTSGSGSGKIPDALIMLFVFIAIIVGVIFIGIPLIRFLFYRIKFYIQCKLFLNSSKYAKGAWFFKANVFGWAFLPYWFRKKPDFVIASKGVTYVVKMRAFYDSRKRINFISPEGWHYCHEKKKRKFGEQLLTIKSQQQKELIRKAKPAPMYMVTYARRLAKEIDVPCVPVVLISPDIKFLFTKNGVVMSNGDYTFYGLVIANNKSMSDLLRRSENNPLEPLTVAEKDELNAKIKSVMKMKLR
ncbi:MAG: hypothetical protein DBX47_02410 [Clostridiales bacterium]|nr:MAG: hypothetical protein DBX47_02410 [Clostridiales bacterium]